jgi:hypothetical protein
MTGQVFPPADYFPGRLFWLLFAAISLLMLAVWWRGRNRD